MKRIIVSAILLAPAVMVAQDNAANPRALLEAVRTLITEQNTAAVKPKDPTDQMLIANERALREAVIKDDTATFKSLVLPEGVWTTKTGFVPFKLLADGLGTFQVTRWEIVNPHVTWLDKDSAIVLYTWTATGTFQNQPLAPTTLASTVWTRRNGKWLAVHHQETDLTKN